jgi:hypothetical protein
MALDLLLMLGAYVAPSTCKLFSFEASLLDRLKLMFLLKANCAWSESACFIEESESSLSVEQHIIAIKKFSNVALST